MEEAKFDILLRKAAQQTTRRGALGALISGAVLLGDLDASDADKKAKRRKQRRPINKPIWVWVDNTSGISSVRVDHYWRDVVNCCITVNQGVFVGAGERVPFASQNRWLALRIQGYDWIDFFNPQVGLPSVAAAVGGVAAPRQDPMWFRSWCCFPEGRRMLSGKGLNPNESVNISMEGPIFTVRRHRDTNYKEFTLTLPASLPEVGVAAGE